MKKILYVPVVFIGLIFCPAPMVHAQGGVSINTSASAPDPSAMIDVNSANKGALLPRMTTVQRNGIANPATGLTIFNTDCGVYNFNAGTPASPNWATMNSSNALIASVSVSANPVGAICSGTSVTFTATPSAGINSPTYQWQVNGGNVGSNSSTYTSASLNNGDIVTCILSSSQACVTGSPATSNSISMTVNPAPSTPGSITGNTSLCANTVGNIYSITPVSGASSYNWTVPGGASITSGSGNASITVTFGSSSGNITVAAVNSCGTSSQVNDAITITSIPSTPGSVSGPNSVCPSATSQIYSISSVSQATSYNWTVPSGASIIANNDTSITVNFGGNPAGNVAVSATNACGTGSQSSLSVSQSNICSPYTFSYTGSAQSFTVPDGVTSLTIAAYGAAGGTGYDGDCSGGDGGEAYGIVTVTPGSVLYIYVGGMGGNAVNSIGGVGGYNGGGAGESNNDAGAGGGGASDVRLGGTDLANRIIVGGGGGGGASANCGDGGYGGGPSGTAGTANGGTPGGGGTQNGGGNGGAGTGGNGTLGTGGVAGNGNSGCGGGGGGGYYGGGGGSATCCGGPGGGGSSYYGGMTSNTGYNNNVQSGNGQVVFAW